MKKIMGRLINYFIIVSIICANVVWANNSCNCAIQNSFSLNKSNSCCSTVSTTCKHCDSKKQKQNNCNCNGNCKCNYLKKSNNHDSELPEEFSAEQRTNITIKLIYQPSINSFNILNKYYLHIPVSKEHNIHTLTCLKSIPLRV